MPPAMDERTREAGVRLFVDRLLLLPLVTWRDAAMACPRQLSAPIEQRLADAVRMPGLALDVWTIRDNIETAFCRFNCWEGHALLRTRDQRAHVRLVSERAALAVLVHEALPVPCFSTCYGGFGGCIPLATLHLHRT
jgi:hypothetical protein